MTMFRGQNTLEISKKLVAISLLILSGLCLFLLRFSTDAIAYFSDLPILMVVPFVFLSVVFVVKLETENVQPAARFLILSLGYALGLYSLLSWRLKLPEELGVEQILNSGLLLNQILVLISMFLLRKNLSYYYVIATNVIVYKILVKKILLLPSLSKTDYTAPLEVGLFCLTAIILRDWSVPFSQYIKNRKNWKWAVPRRAVFHDFIVICGFAVFFSNYFWSGVEKIKLAPILTWALENETSLLIAVSYQAGCLPIGHWLEVSQWAYMLMSNVNALGNLFVLATQLSSIWFLFWRRSAVVALMLYEIEHLLIFLVSGILFWKWMVLSLLGFEVFRRLSSTSCWSRYRTPIVVIILLAPSLLHIVTLGWFDTRAFNNYRFEAVDDKGERYRVPSNYFTHGALTIAQGRLGTVESLVYPTRTWGGTKDRTIHTKVAECADFEKLRVDLSDVYNAKEQDIQRFIERYHSIILKNLDDEGLIHYDRFPHHIVSNPWMFGEFFALDKRKIVAYEYVVESLCIDKETVSKREVKGLTRYRFDL